MKRLLLVALCLLASAARASDDVGIDMSATSPSTVTTAVGYTASTGIGIYTTCSVYVVATGGTGGTLDIYIQTGFKKVNASPVWVDVAHLPQIAAGAAAAGFALTLTRWSSSAAAVVASINTTSATPVLAVNTVVSGILGYQLRVVFKTGAGTTLGAAQSVLAHCSGS